MTAPVQLKHKKSSQLSRVDVPKLPTVDDVRKAVPAHCFKKDVFRSIRYLIQDYILLALLYVVLPYVEYYGSWFGLIAWYWAFGFVGCALFVVGHDCGHGTFSDYVWVNDLCGHLAHAPILAPYWPWQKSHRQHHQYTSHLTKDKGHPWVTEEAYHSRNIIEKYFAAFPLSGWLRWNPIYTVIGLPDGSHFWPWSRLFTSTEDRIKCTISGFACLICAYVSHLILFFMLSTTNISYLHINISAFQIVFALFNYSLFSWIKYYYVPLTFQGLIMVMITYLQHQSENIEVYEHDEWSFVRGQTQTIDRTWGFGLDKLMHNITDGHVAHHFFFTKIPHYNLLDATDAIKRIFEMYCGIFQLLEPYKGTPYGYKSETNYDFFFKYLNFNVNLDYLIHKSKGVLQYRVGVEGKGIEKTH
uniref:FA_desaturase domain-containing protein n=1 Tax=Heterorhabditis bacteriophora TaxID=37862 RepID=A0A1I7WMJ5_HETBA